MADTLHKVLQDIANALVISHGLCTAASASLTDMQTHVDQSKKAIERSRALLLRAESSGSRVTR